MVSANFYARSGIPFDQLIPHPVYGDNEGFGVPRGTAINPLTGRNRTPTNFQLDLGAYYPISFGERKELRFMVDWFNVTNTQRALREDKTDLINSGISGVPPVTNTTYRNGPNLPIPIHSEAGCEVLVLSHTFDSGTAQIVPEIYREKHQQVCFSLFLL